MNRNAATTTPLIVEDLHVTYGETRGGPDVRAVKGVSWQLHPGKITGLAGESGSGKSTALLASMGYRAPGTQIAAKSLRLNGTEILGLNYKGLRQRWGAEIAYVAQNAALALHSSHTVGKQIDHVLRAHTDLSSNARRSYGVELLGDLDLPDPRAALRRYPYQFSGGQQQRIALGVALAANPDVLLLDEPTTGLDVTTQARISALLRSITVERSLSLLYVSHDLALLGSLCDEIHIMQGGHQVESGSTQNILSRPSMRYTVKLLDSVPSLPPSNSVDPTITPSAKAPSVGRTEADALLKAENLSCRYRKKTAVRDVSLTIGRGEIVGIVGESGSGKSTILRAIAGLHDGVSGRILMDSQSLHKKVARRPHASRSAIQLVLQNPQAALNPRHTAIESVTRAVHLFRKEIPPGETENAAADMLDQVGLGVETWRRTALELSGGQCQRVALARAVVAMPQLLLCDEVTSALDVSVQAQILDLIKKLAAERSMAVALVTHDLRVVRELADRVVVLRDGSIQEERTVEELFDDPRNNYTRQLLQSIPKMPERSNDSHLPT